MSFLDLFPEFRKKWMVFHSSKFLVNKMLGFADFNKDLNIVLFGSGEWVFTRAILKNMNLNSKLYAFEINKSCKKYVENIDDQRFIYIEDSAENIEDFVYEDLDLIISTLPFASLPDWSVKTNLGPAYRKLKNNWLFLQYQYFLTNKKQIESLFQKKSRISFQLLNVPPAFIYILRK